MHWLFALTLFAAGCHEIFAFQSESTGPADAEAGIPADYRMADTIDWNGVFSPKEPTIVNAVTRSHQFEARIDQLVGGTLAVVWHSDGQDSPTPPGSTYGGLGIFGRILGTSPSSEFPINIRTQVGQLQPALASLGDRFVTAWLSQSSDASGDAIRFNLRDNEGNLLGEELQANTIETSDQLNPAVHKLDDDAFVIAWRSRGGADGDGSGIFAQAFDRSGRKIDAEFQVNTFSSGDQTHPAIASIGAGKYVIVWNSEGQDGAGAGVYGQIFARPATPIGAEFQVNTTTDGDQQRPDVAAFADGSFVVAWESEAVERSIRAQRFDSAGKVDGELVVNSTSIGSRPSWVSGTRPAICVFPNDSHYLIAWGSHLTDGSGNGAYGQLFHRQQGLVGGQFQLTDDPIELTDQKTAFRYSVDIVCVRDGEFAAVWVSSGTDGLDVSFASYTLR